MASSQPGPRGLDSSFKLQLVEVGIRMMPRTLGTPSQAARDAILQKLNVPLRVPAKVSANLGVLDDLRVPNDLLPGTLHADLLGFFEIAAMLFHDDPKGIHHARLARFRGVCVLLGVGVEVVD